MVGISQSYGDSGAVIGEKHFWLDENGREEIWTSLGGAWRIGLTPWKMRSGLINTTDAIQ